MTEPGILLIVLHEILINMFPFMRMNIHTYIFTEPIREGNKQTPMVVLIVLHLAIYHS